MVRNSMTKKEYVYVGSCMHFTDGHCETEPIKMVDKEVFDKAMKKHNEYIEKNYKKTEGGWYVKK